MRAETPRQAFATPALPERGGRRCECEVCSATRHAARPACDGGMETGQWEGAREGLAYLA